MENIKADWFYISVDGDSIGAKVGRAVLANDVDELHKVSARIDAAQDYIVNWCKEVGGIKISGGGDEATMAIPPESKEKIKNLRKGIEESFGYTISVGVGRNLAEAGTALLVAKLRGKDRIIYFNKKIKKDILKAKRRVREKRATVDEYKLAEAYLTKAEDMKKLCELHKKEKHKEHMHILHKHEEGFHQSAATEDDVCPYCVDNEDSRTDDCAYCQDLDAEENADGTAGMHDCPACKEYDASMQNTGGIETDDCSYCQEDDALHNSDPDNCEMCQEYNAAQGTKDLENITEVQDNPGQPQEHICNCPYCVANKKDQTDLAVEDMAAQRPDECAECQKMYSDAIENQPDQTGQEDPNLQGHETAEEVLDLLDQEPGKDSQTPAQEAKKIDNTELPQGDQMRENVSVKENFGNTQKEDISDADKQFGQQETNVSGDANEESPNVAEVLKDNLSENADSIQRDKVIDMVSQTLQGFKSNKEFLESTKDQNPELYNSCIQMLKAMIELCKLLGLEPKMPAQQDQSASTQEAPIQQAAPMEGAAESPKAQG